MIRRWTDSELMDELSNLTVVADTREQQNGHITDWLAEKSVPVIRRKLDIGDYSVSLGDRTLEKSCVVERKHTLDELCLNLTSDRERFEREFIRAKANGTKVFLIIEDASWEDVYLGNYRSKLPVKSLVASLMAWQVRFNVTIIFCSSGNTPRILFQLLYYAAREDLLNGV